MKKYVLKGIVLLSTGYAFVRLVHWPIGFTFFTQLSNLYVALVVLFQLVGKKNYSLWKYTAVVSIIITFLVYLLVLAPRMPGGLPAAYRQDHYASLCLHIITPVTATADFLLHDVNYPWRAKHIFCALLPPVCYLLFILALGQAGVRWGRWNMTAPYLFLNYSAPAGWFGFMPETADYTTLGIGVFYAIIVMIGVFILVAWLLLRAAEKRVYCNAGELEACNR